MSRQMKHFLQFLVATSVVASIVLTLREAIRVTREAKNFDPYELFLEVDDYDKFVDDKGTSDQPTQTGCSDFDCTVCYPN